MYPALQRLIWTLPIAALAGLCFSGVAATQQVPTPPDPGSGNPANRIGQAVANGLLDGFEKLSPAQRVSLIRKHELSLEKRRLTIPETEYWAEVREIGGLYWQARGYEEASRVFLSIAEARPDSLMAADAWMMLGAVSGSNGSDFRGAVAPLEKAIGILEALPDDQQSFERDALLARSLCYLGLCFELTERPDQAADQYRKFLENPAAVAAADRNNELSISSSLAQIRFRQERFEESSALLRRVD